MSMKAIKKTTDDIFKDYRGEMHFYELGDLKFHITFSKTGMLRAGDYHPDWQRDLILSGRMEVTTREGDNDVVKVYGPNKLIQIPPDVPHLYRSLTDTTMLEWREGDYKVKYYPPYRDLIDKQAKEFSQ
ncbi:MAG: hypothetical protein AAB490_04610 [Patescibacteria group bacterium]